MYGSEARFSGNENAKNKVRFVSLEFEHFLMTIVGIKLLTIIYLIIHMYKDNIFYCHVGMFHVV